jgi:phenylacetate-CoA ligase
MALQARLLQQLMERDGVPVTFLATNLAFPKWLAFCEWLRGVRPFLRSAVFCWRLWRLLGRADVVHILACSWLYFFVAVCPAVVLSRLHGRRVILNYRGGEADTFLASYGMLAKPFFRMAHTVTAPSGFLVEVIGRRIGVDVRIVPNVADFGRFRFRRRQEFRPRLVVTRHLEKLYDVETVIRAFGLVQSRYPEAELHIAGTGNQENYLRGLVQTLNLRHVVFAGYVPTQDLPALYDACDILLNASLADNFPASLVEAAAAGVAVVSTAVGGIPYIFEHNDSALLVPPGDWRALAEAVLRLLNEPELGSRLTTQAFQQCRQYDWSNVRSALYATYGFEDMTLEAVSAAAVETPAVRRKHS